jgi:hypothetical protein
MFKALEATLLAVGGAMLLSLIGLSQQFLETGATDPGYFQASAGLSLSQQFWAARLAALAYLVATPMLNVLLYRSQLVPRFMSLVSLRRRPRSPPPAPPRSPVSWPSVRQAADLATCTSLAASTTPIALECQSWRLLRISLPRKIGGTSHYVN